MFLQSCLWKARGGFFWIRSAKAVSSLFPIFHYCTGMQSIFTDYDRICFFISHSVKKSIFLETISNEPKYMEPVFCLPGQTDTLDTAAAWSLLKEGHMDGLDFLYKTFAEELFRIGMAMVPHREFVWDCVQDVFVDLWKYHQNLAETDQVNLYLYKSLSNKVKKEIKKHSKHGVSVGEGETEIVSAFESVEQRWIMDEQDTQWKRKVALGLQKLPLRQRELIHYLFFENFSYEECSKLLDINLRSVYTLAWKAIKSLKKYVAIFPLIGWIVFG